MAGLINYLPVANTYGEVVCPVFFSGYTASTVAERYAASAANSLANLIDFCQPVTMSSFLGSLHRFEDTRDFNLPGRHIYFAAAAANMGADKVLICTEHGQDFSADRTEEFYKKIENLLSYTFSRPISVYSPIAAYTKAEAIYAAIYNLMTYFSKSLAQAVQLFDATFSCYSPPAEGVRHCGECQACVLRYFAFELVNGCLVSGVTPRVVNTPLFTQITWDGKTLLNTLEFHTPPRVTDTFKNYMAFKKHPAKIRHNIEQFAEHRLAEKAARSVVLKRPPAPVSSRASGFFRDSKYVVEPSSRAFIRRKYRFVFNIVTCYDFEALAAAIESILALGLKDALICVYFNPPEFGADRRKSFTKIRWENFFKWGQVYTDKGTYVKTVSLSSNIVFITGERPASLPFCRNAMVAETAKYTAVECGNGIPATFIYFLDDDVVINDVSAVLGPLDTYNELRRKYETPRLPFFITHQVAVYGPKHDFKSLYYLYNDPEAPLNGLTTLQSLSRYFGSMFSFTGYFMGMPAHMLSSVEGIRFDDDFSFWFEDTDFTRSFVKYSRVPSMSYVFPVPKNSVTHKGHKTQMHSSKIYSPGAIQQDKNTYIKKWGFKDL